MIEFLVLLLVEGVVQICSKFVMEEFKPLWSSSIIINVGAMVWLDDTTDGARDGGGTKVGSWVMIAVAVDGAMDGVLVGVVL